MEFGSTGARLVSSAGKEAGFMFRNETPEGLFLPFLQSLLSMGAAQAEVSVVFVEFRCRLDYVECKLTFFHLVPQYFLTHQLRFASCK